MKVDIAVQTEQIYEEIYSSATSSRASSVQDLLVAWEDLLGWSENAAAARKLQEEMIVLKQSLTRLGNKSSFELLDTEPSIQIAIETLKHEKIQLQTYRTQMLRLNASVHSWLTRQERKLQAAMAESNAVAGAATKIGATESTHKEMRQEQQQQQQQQHEIEQNAAANTIDNSNNNNQRLEMETVSISIVTGIGTGTDTGTAITTTATATDNKVAAAQLETLMHSEYEFHKHLKDEVGDMYSAWDEADARISAQLELLTSSLIAWRQLECGLFELQQALGKDRGTLLGLEGALNQGQTAPIDLAHNVKLVAKLLSERVINNSNNNNNNIAVGQEQLQETLLTNLQQQQQQQFDAKQVLHIAHKFTASNGSLSDSGISDGGATSDGGLSERERRLGVLRRLAKQLESALAPGSEAMKSIAARMESAEAELKQLQNTCRDLIVRTAATQQKQQQQTQQQKQQKQQQQQQQKQQQQQLLLESAQQQPAMKSSAENIGALRQRRNSRRAERNQTHDDNNNNNNKHMSISPDGDGDDPVDDPALEFDLDNSSDDGVEEKPRKNFGWAWRIAKAALPMQMALFTFLCAACFLQPNCCDNLNNFSMSFTPQLRYIRGPPPI